MYDFIMHIGLLVETKKQNKLNTVLSRFLEQTNSNLALMINGDWGIGKTHYLKNHLMPELKTEMKVYYVSLYGISDVKEIFTQILFQQSSLFDKIHNTRFGRIAGGVLSSAVSLGLKNLPKFNADTNDFKFEIHDLVNFENSIIIFDDIERISKQIETSDLLGIINNIFIEQESVKVILVSNESKITDKRYFEVKEKIIGWTVDFEMSYLEVISSINESYTANSSFKSFLDSMKDFLCQILAFYEYKNLRTILFFYDCLESINSQIDLSKLISKKSLFYSIFILCSEYKNGSLEDFKKVKILPPYIDRSNLNILNNQSKMDDSDLRKRFDAYSANNLMKEYNFEFQYFYVDSIFRLILEAKVDFEKLKNEIGKIESYLLLNSESEFSEACKKLQGYFYLKNDEYLKNFNFVYNSILQVQLTLDEFIYGVKTIYYLSRKKELNIDKKTLKKEFSKALSNQKFEEEYHYLTLSFMERNLNEIKVFNPELEQELKQIVMKLHRQKEQREFIKKWENEFIEIRDDYTIRKIIESVSANEIVNKIIENISNSNYLEFFSIRLKSAYKHPQQFLPDHAQDEAKFREIKAALIKEAKSGKYELIELVWINEFIDEVSNIRANFKTKNAVLNG